MKRYYDNSKPLGPIKQSNQLIVGVDWLYCVLLTITSCIKMSFYYRHKIFYSSSKNWFFDAPRDMFQLKLWDFEGNDCKLCKTSTRKDIGEWPKNKRNIKQNEISSMNDR